MSTTVINPGESHTFKDTEGGTDLTVFNKNDDSGTFTYAVNSGQAREHTIAGHGSWYAEVADRQSGTVANTGEVSLTATFG